MAGAYNEEAATAEDAYNINLVPSEFFLKFRKEIEGLRVGLNLEFYNFEGNEYHAKLVLKPLARRWKFVYEPLHGDIRLLSKKFPLSRYINLQVGVGHNFQYNATGWKWKLSTSLGGDGVSQIRNKTAVCLFPGFDLRFGWRAEYILPEIHGAMGTGEPMFNMNYGRLQASLDRVEAIVTHTTLRDSCCRGDQLLKKQAVPFNDSDCSSSGPCVDESCGKIFSQRVTVS